MDARLTVDVARHMAAVADRARRAEAEAIRMHGWAEDGCPPPPPVRPPSAARQIHTRFDPPYTQLEKT